MIIDPALTQWATPRQAEIINSVAEHNTISAASRAMNLDRGYISRTLKIVKDRAALHGYSPDHDLTHVVPTPFVVRGVSTLYDKDGSVSAQWVKTRVEDQCFEEAIRSAVEALSQDIKRVEPTPSPNVSNVDLANLFTITDAHIGSKSWEQETGADWDLDIAEQVITGAACHLVKVTPRAKTAIVNFLGDLHHFDSLEAVTPQHRNLLDSDSRFPKVVQVAVRILRRVIDLALTRHDKVIVSFQEGNHDLASTVWQRMLFSIVYENEPRVEVLQNVTPYSVIEHGEVMLAFHHGHMVKNDKLPGLFAAQFPREWGRTTRRYCHTGHRHHSEEIETGGMFVIQHPTIAARDAYAARGGWISDRLMTAITYHNKHGQVSRTTCVPEMIS